MYADSFVLACRGIGISAITDVMEGGEKAFKFRKEKYSF
jgi:hypothetical protein